MKSTFSSFNIEKSFELLSLNEQYVISELPEKFEQLK